MSNDSGRAARKIVKPSEPIVGQIGGDIALELSERFTARKRSGILYKLEVLEPPNERLRHRREFHADDDAEAIKEADKIFDGFAADRRIKLDRYVLYDGSRVVHERVER